MNIQVADPHFIPFLNNAAIRGHVDVNNVVWMNATDIARLLEYRDAPTLCRYLDEDEKKMATMETTQGLQTGWHISEAGLYHALDFSSHPQAKVFKRWADHELFPCIRQYGIYISPATLSMLAENPNIIEELSAKVKEYQHKAQLQRLYHLIDKERAPFCEFSKLEDLNAKLKTSLTNMEDRYYEMYLQARGVNQMFDHLAAAMM